MSIGSVRRRLGHTVNDRHFSTGLHHSVHLTGPQHVSPSAASIQCKLFIATVQASCFCVKCPLDLYGFWNIYPAGYYTLGGIRLPLNLQLLCVLSSHLSSLMYVL